MFRRIGAACALFAVVAMGFAAPAEAGTREDTAAGASGLDTALVLASARRVRDRGTAAGLDGRPDGNGHAPVGLFHPLWLGAAVLLPVPVFVAEGGVSRALLRAPAPPVFASRTSRGPPSRS
ncbi:MAG TPA: hypothetical protein VH328_12660 [Burkholderiaceae bacterium]|jgi:hypothetical protein|nr:hypothetical protein [Burkholderiaceae bacterium]